jgi:hypothetical protein
MTALRRWLRRAYFWTDFFVGGWIGYYRAHRRDRGPCAWSPLRFAMWATWHDLRFHWGRQHEDEEAGR